MNARLDDLTPEEKKFLGRQDASLSDLRAHHADCPRLEVLLALRSGVIPEDTARSVAGHVSRCNFCQKLLDDLVSEQLIAVSVEEKERVHERVLSAREPETESVRKGPGFFSAWSWKTISVTALAAAAVILVAWIRFHGIRPLSPPQTTAIQQPANPAAPGTMEWEKLPIRLQASSVLVVRGKPKTAQEKYASELTSALKYYLDNNYTEAVKQLSAVVSEFPQGVEAQLYLGISRLKLDQNADSIAPLRAAQQLGPEQFRDDATWYLAMAYQRTGDARSALSELQKLCRGTSSYASRACTVADQLSSQSGTNPSR